MSFIPAMLIPVILLAGCAGPGATRGKLRAESLRDEPVVLGSRYQTVVYSHNPSGETTFLLSDTPVEELLAGSMTQGQVMHINLLWEPKAGATPLDSAATNASIRHVIVSGGEVGVYGGAGFAMPGGTPGRAKLSVAVRDATVRLLESTDGFNDPLSPARITGNFTAIHDPKLARKLRLAVSQFVTNALGRSRLVTTTESREPSSP